MDMSQTEWKRTGEKKVKCNRCQFLHDPERDSKDMQEYSLQWRDESKEQSVNITYLTSSDCQSSHANPFYFFLGGGGTHWVCTRLDPHLGYIILWCCCRHLHRHRNCTFY